MTSWTKIWSCTGVRLGSVVAPTAEKLAAVKAKQVPWSVNCVALVSQQAEDPKGRKATAVSLLAQPGLAV